MSRSTPQGAHSSDERKSVPLFLCCAEDNEIGLVRVVEALHKEGFNPEVIAGVDGDGSLLGRAVDQVESRALFVLCRSDQLDRAHIRRLEGLFSARRGPQHRLLTVQLVANRPLGMMPSIREAMRDLVEAPPEAMRPSTDANRDLFRDVIGPDTSRPSPGREEREELARKLHQEMLAAEALLTRRSSEPRKAEVMPEPKGDGVPDLPLPDPGAGPLLPDEEDDHTLKLDLDASGDERGVPDPRADDVDEPVSPAPTHAAAAGGPSADTPFAGEEQDDPERTDEADVGASAVQRARPPEEPEERPLGRGLTYGGIVGLAAAVVMAVSFIGVEEEPDADVQAAVKRANAKAARRSNTPATKPNPTPAAVAVEGHPSAPTDIEDPPTPAESGDDDPPEDPEGDDGGVAVKPPSTAVPPAPASERTLAERAGTALAQGKLEAVGNLLVHQGAGESSTWSSAARACRRRSVDGIAGFGLPTRRQLERLEEAGVLQSSAYYWTRDRESPDEAYAMNVSTGDMNVYLTVESIARPICVRRKP